jgi:hypothetical protein
VSDEGHFALRQAHAELTDWLDHLPQRLDHGEVQHLERSDAADRVKAFGLHIRGAVSLADQGLYAPAFALFRVAIEHLVLDQLMLLASTYVEVIHNVSAVTWQEWQERHEQDPDWLADMREWSRSKKGTVRIVHEGLFTEPDERGERQQVSIYYFLLDDFEPGLGPPSAQTESGLIDLPLLRDRAKTNQAIWQTYLTWSSLKESLRHNHLTTDGDLLMLDAHYRFLSGFVHPVSRDQRRIYGRSMSWPVQDHYAMELSLLYAVAFSCQELTSYLRMADQHDDFGIVDRSRLNASLAAAKYACADLWFLDGKPHALDHFNERNRQAWLRRESGVPQPPDSVAPESIPYYSDPLERVVAMHRTTQELTTGLVFESPWPRDDARFR